jgi:hypothetical protein
MEILQERSGTSSPGLSSYTVRTESSERTTDDWTEEAEVPPHAAYDEPTLPAEPEPVEEDYLQETEVLPDAAYDEPTLPAEPEPVEEDYPQEAEAEPIHDPRDILPPIRSPVTSKKSKKGK